MRILVLTTEDHIYANYLIKKIFCEYFRDEEVLIIESSTLLHKKTKIESIITYLKKAGFLYVLYLSVKVYFVKLLWLVGKIRKTKDIESSFVSWKELIKKIDIRKVDDINSDENVRYINEFDPALIMSLYFNQIISDKTLNLVKTEVINIHPSYLPNYKGISPTFWALAENQDESGVTVHEISKGIDEGGIIAQKRVSINDNDSEHSLYVRCTKAGLELLKELIVRYKEGEVVNKKMHVGSGKYCSIPKKEIVKKFIKSKKRFYKFRELIKDFKSIK